MVEIAHAKCPKFGPAQTSQADGNGGQVRAQLILLLECVGESFPGERLKAVARVSCAKWHPHCLHRVADYDPFPDGIGEHCTEGRSSSLNSGASLDSKLLGLAH